MAGINLTRTLCDQGLKIKRSAGDGHCLLYSIVSSWNAQLSAKPKLDLELLKTHLVNEVLDHALEYQVIGDFSMDCILIYLANITISFLLAFAHSQTG